jgi:hypothetical protein
VPIAIAGQAKAMKATSARHISRTIQVVANGAIASNSCGSLSQSGVVAASARPAVAAAIGAASAIRADKLGATAAPTPRQTRKMANMRPNA